jgi:hypothetical protein
MQKRCPKLQKNYCLENVDVLESRHEASLARAKYFSSVLGPRVLPIYDPGDIVEGFLPGYPVTTSAISLRSIPASCSIEWLLHHPQC